MTRGAQGIQNAGIRPRRDATLKDVAGLAGVSTATIARVLHNNGYVADETRRTVEAALAQTGYRVNAVAQGLRRQRTYLLGHIVHAVAPNPFFAVVAHGVQQEAARHNCGVIVFNTQGLTTLERNAVETLLRQRVDAVLFTTVVDDANIELAANAGTPVVQVERVGTVDTLAVSVDNHRGAFDATAHLIALGHRRIAFIGVDPNHPMGMDAEGSDTGKVERRAVEYERLGGYLDALQAHDVPVHDTLIDLGTTYYSPPRGRDVTRRLLALAADERPTAIFAGCDLLAAGVIQECLDRGLHIPHDLSVVGFDDTHASLLAPPLTTVAQPMLELGEVAARLAIGALAHRDTGVFIRRERLTTKLIVRNSTGPVPAGS